MNDNKMLLITTSGQEINIQEFELCGIFWFLA